MFFLPSPLLSEDLDYLKFHIEDTRLAILSGDWSPILLDDMVTLISNYFQYTEGDYDPNLHTSTRLKKLTQNCTSPEWQNSDTLIDDIIKQYEKKQGLNTLQSALQFLEEAKKLPTFGNRFFYVTSGNTTYLLSISYKEISLFNPQTQQIMRKWQYQQLELATLARDDTVVLQFSNSTLTLNTTDAEQISILLLGYHKFWLKEKESCLIM